MASVVVLGKLSEHPGSIRGAQESTAAARALGPEGFKEAVAYDGHQELVTFPDLNPTRVSGRVPIGEIENGTVWLALGVQGPFDGGQLGGEVGRGKLACLDSKLGKELQGLLLSPL